MTHHRRDVLVWVSEWVRSAQTLLLRASCITPCLCRDPVKHRLPSTQPCKCQERSSRGKLPAGQACALGHSRLMDLNMGQTQSLISNSLYSSVQERYNESKRIITIGLQSMSKLKLKCYKSCRGRKIPNFYLGRKTFRQMFLMVVASYLQLYLPKRGKAFQSKKMTSKTYRWKGTEYTQQWSGSISLEEDTLVQSPGSENSLWVQTWPHPLMSVILDKLHELPESQIIQP